MTEHEILEEYLQAKSKKKELRVLADLNQVSMSEIARIVEAQGVPVQKPYGHGLNPGANPYENMAAIPEPAITEPETAVWREEEIEETRVVVEAIDHYMQLLEKDITEAEERLAALVKKHDVLIRKKKLCEEITL